MKQKKLIKIVKVIYKERLAPAKITQIGNVGITTSESESEKSPIIIYDTSSESESERCPIIISDSKSEM